jgi:hypothetical protein
MKKYIYSPRHQGLVEAPLMEKPRYFYEQTHMESIEYRKRESAYNTWLSSQPIYKVRPEDIEWFSVERGEDVDFYILKDWSRTPIEVVAIPKKGNESKEQIPSVDLDQVVYVPTSALEKPEKEGWYHVAYLLDGEETHKRYTLYFGDKWYNHHQHDFSHWLKKTTLRELIQPTL